MFSGLMHFAQLKMSGNMQTASLALSNLVKKQSLQHFLPLNFPLKNFGNFRHFDKIKSLRKQQMFCGAQQQSQNTKRKILTILKYTNNGSVLHSFRTCDTCEHKSLCILTAHQMSVVVAFICVPPRCCSQCIYPHFPLISSHGFLILILINVRQFGHMFASPQPKTRK